MVYWKYETSDIEVDSPGNHSGTSVSLCLESSGSTHWVEDCRSSADCGGSATEMDLRSVRSHEAKPESLDAQSQCQWIEGAAALAQIRSPHSLDAKSGPGPGEVLGKAASGSGSTSCAVGWSNSGCVSEETVWDEVDSSASPTMVPSTGVSAQASEPCVSASFFGASQAISPEGKKNSGHWDGEKRLSSRMRVDLRFIRVWVEGGPSVADG